MSNENVCSNWFGRTGFHMLCGGSGPRIVLPRMGSHVPRSREGARGRIAILCLCLTFVLATPARPQESVGTFTTFDVPGAGTGVLQGTIGLSINAAGDIAGIYLVSPNVAHGFVRAANGTITTFDAPNAGTGMNQGTFPVSINMAGDIAGTYFDSKNVYHGFVRAADGTITEFNAPGAGTGGHRGTTPFSIGAAGDITGTYNDNSAVRHGFVRAASGTITTFDVPGAGTSSTQGTQPISINAAGDIAGFYLDAKGGFHGFMRAANGAITAPIDVPGAGTSGGTEHHGNVVGTLALCINAAGDITGIYSDTSGVRHAFVRAADGTMTYPIDAPDVATKGPVFVLVTFAASINTAGLIAGTYNDTSGVFHVFVRATNGTITAPVDDPNAGAAGTSVFPGTFSLSINDLGVLTGGYADANGVLHGFVLKLAIAPETQVANLQNIVEALVSAGILNPGRGQFLLAPLNAALADLDPGHTAARAALDRGHTAAAIRNLDEFIGRVRLLMLFRHLSHAEGRILIDAADDIIKALRVHIEFRSCNPRSFPLCCVEGG